MFVNQIAHIIQATKYFLKYGLNIYSWESDSSSGSLNSKSSLILFTQISMQNIFSRKGKVELRGGGD